LPRRCAPRNDINWSHCEPSPLSLRAEGEAIHLSFRTTCQMDCHVVSLLAMTNRERSLRTIPTVIASRPTVIASRRRSNPAFVLHHLNIDCHVVSLLAMTGIRVIASQRRSNPAFVLHHLKNRLPRRFTPRNDGVGVDCHVVSLLAMTGIRVIASHPHCHCEPEAKQSILSLAPPEIWIATSLCSSQ